MFKNMLRKILSKKVKQFVKRLLGMPLTSIHPDWQMLDVIVPPQETHIVLDVGSRNGWFFQCWKSWCSSAIIHAFEPDIAAYNKLKEKYKESADINISPLGISDKASIETFYHLADSEVSSSFLPHDQNLWDEIKYQTGEIEQRQLEVTTLDSYSKENSIENVFLIKIDIQGYELKALQGGVGILKNTSYVLVESAISPLYQGGAKFGQVHEVMLENNFHLINFRAWHRGNNKLLEADLLFRHDDLLPEAEPTGSRYYIGSAT